MIKKIEQNRDIFITQNSYFIKFKWNRANPRGKLTPKPIRHCENIELEAFLLKVYVSHGLTVKKAGRGAHIGHHNNNGPFLLVREW